MYVCMHISHMQSLVGALPSLRSSSTAKETTPATKQTPSASATAASVPKGEPVGVGLGIKKNHFGDFMITEVAEGGVAAETGKIKVGDVLVAIGK